VKTLKLVVKIIIAIGNFVRSEVLKPTKKYEVETKTTGIKNDNGNSVNTFAEKYALTVYILLLTSLKNTGLSNGKIAEALLTPLNDELSERKNRAPFLF
jgi:hypothetical protein